MSLYNFNNGEEKEYEKIIWMFSCCYVMFRIIRKCICTRYFTTCCNRYLDKDTNEFIYNSSGTYVGSVRCHSKVEVRRIGSTFSYSILNKSNDGFYPSGSSYTCNVSNLTNIQQGNNYLVRWNAQVKRGSGVDRNQTLTHKY